MLDTYVIAVAADGALVLVDQHAAHERLTHEALRTQMLDGGVRSQPLLLPAVVDLPPADAARLLDRAADLARLGLEIEAFGPGAVLVRALPAALGAPDPAPLLRDLADELAELDETTALDGPARRGDRPPGLPRQHPRRPPPRRRPRWTRCCARWRPPRAPPPAATAAPPSSSSPVPSSNACSVGAERRFLAGHARMHSRPRHRR